MWDIPVEAEVPLLGEAVPGTAGEAAGDAADDAAVAADAALTVPDDDGGVSAEHAAEQISTGKTTPSSPGTQRPGRART
ncbi:hypothetical protein AB4089_02235 [Arthrobacter sp. 2MCAF15]